MSKPSPARTAVPSPPTYPAGPEVAGKSCSICQTAIIAGEQVLNCPHCSLPFHAECWAENQGCSAYGCEGAPQTAQKAPLAEPVSDAWGDEKPCPSCKRTIKAEALKCRFCGASFNTRNVISREQYASREYEGTEFNAVRNKTILLFLLSAAGCLAPLGLILSGVLISQKQFMGIDYRRLPPTLKAVVWAAVGIGSLMMVLLLALVVLDS